MADTKPHVGRIVAPKCICLRWPTYYGCHGIRGDAAWRCFGCKYKITECTCKPPVQ